ncbi:MAG: glycerol-3-phosphate dehydrogenase [Rhodospirillales bacterium]|nr:glycerol-3-phosphate dehydrogenase [Rhodospirillales bacterium]
MQEGSLEAPTRHSIPWRDADFYDEDKLDKELRRVFDICHGCRRCFNLCDSFPTLFDLIDESDSGELDSVKSADFKPAIDACTLCDMCFMVKCPYVPPHHFDLDFPHLMLRYRAVQFKKGNVSALQQRLSETDKNGKLGCSASSIANWACSCSNGLTRPLMQSVAGIDRDAALPKFNERPLSGQNSDISINTSAPAHGRKVVIYSTCSGEYHNADLGLASQRVLAENGVETQIVYPGCCSMPQLEHGDISRVAISAKRIAAELVTWVDRGYDIVTPVASCSLMLKFEWPLIEPDDKNIAKLSRATFDVSEYLVDISTKEGIADGLKPLVGGVTLHIACHARAQNMGRKGADMLNLIPDTEIKVIERCSGHGGSWGVMKGNFETALKVGKPVARDTAKADSAFVVSECPLAREHILQGIERLDADKPATKWDKGPIQVQHPIQLMAISYQG